MADLTQASLTKGHVRRALWEIYLHRKIRNPSRLDGLDEHCENVIAVALRQNYPFGLLPQQYQHAFQQFRHLAAATIMTGGPAGLPSGPSSGTQPLTQTAPADAADAGPARGTASQPRAQLALPAAEQRSVPIEPAANVISHQNIKDRCVQFREAARAEVEHQQVPPPSGEELATLVTPRGQSSPPRESEVELKLLPDTSSVEIQKPEVEKVKPSDDDMNSEVAGAIKPNPTLKANGFALPPMNLPKANMMIKRGRPSEAAGKKSKKDEVEGPAGVSAPAIVADKPSGGLCIGPVPRPAEGPGLKTTDYAGTSDSESESGPPEKKPRGDAVEEPSPQRPVAPQVALLQNSD